MRFLNLKETVAVCYLLTVLLGITSHAEDKRARPSIFNRNLLIHAGADEPENVQNAVAYCGKQYFRIIWDSLRQLRSAPAGSKPGYLGTIGNTDSTGTLAGGVPQYNRQALGGGTLQTTPIDCCHGAQENDTRCHRRLRSIPSQTRFNSLRGLLYGRQGAGDSGLRLGV